VFSHIVKYHRRGNGDSVRRELSGLGESGTQQTGNLLDEGIRSEEGVVLLRELLHELLVLVELLQVINRHVLEGRASSVSLCWVGENKGAPAMTHLELDELGAINVEGIGKNADGHARAGEMGEPEEKRKLRSVVVTSRMRHMKA
jgi:hypothetical protein